MDSGRRSEALADFNRAAALLGELRQQDAAEPLYRYKLAHVCINRGTLYSTGNQPDLAQADYDQATRLLQELAEQHRFEPIYRYDLGVTALDQGNLLWSQRQYAAAAAAIRKGQALMQKLVDDFPSREGYRKKLAFMHITLGAVFAGTRKWPEAEQEWRTALAVSEKLVQDQPRIPEYRASLGTVHGNLGWLCRRTAPLPFPPWPLGSAWSTSGAVVCTVCPAPPESGTIAGTSGKGHRPAEGGSGAEPRHPGSTGCSAEPALRFDRNPAGARGSCRGGTGCGRLAADIPRQGTVLVPRRSFPGPVCGAGGSSGPAGRGAGLCRAVAGLVAAGDRARGTPMSNGSRPTRSGSRCAGKVTASRPCWDGAPSSRELGDLGKLCHPDRAGWSARAGRFGISCPWRRSSLDRINCPRRGTQGRGPVGGSRRTDHAWSIPKPCAAGSISHRHLVGPDGAGCPRTSNSSGCGRHAVGFHIARAVRRGAIS